MNVLDREINQYMINKEPLEKLTHSQIFDQIISKYDLKTSDWTKIKEAIKKSADGVNENNVDSFIITQFTRQRKYAETNNFLNHIKTSKKNLNIGGLTALLKFYYNSFLYDKITDEDKSNILQIYKDLNSKYPLLSPTIAECCIPALSITSEWKECFNLFDKLNTYEHLPPVYVYGAVIAASLRNDEPDIGWNILKKLIHQDKTPYNSIYESFLTYFAEKYKGKPNKMLSDVEKLLEFVAERSLLFDEKTIKSFDNIFTTRLGWKANYVSIDKRGQCPHCKMFLKPSKVSPDEHEVLKKAFFDEVMIGKNIFLKSNPEEIKDFLQFIKKTEPYDMVVDGLNVALSVAKNVKSPLYLSNRLAAVVTNIIESGRKKVLVLGRKHMLTWPKKQMDFLRNNCYLYLVDDSSYDDTFLLYASLCATHTDFMSRDLMRGHRFLLENEKQIFKRWQEIHQYSLVYMDACGKSSFKKPYKWVRYAQKNSTNWHISYVKDEETLKILDFPKNWLCLKP